MGIGYNEVHLLAEEERFIGKIAAAIAELCDDIRLEAGSTPNHAARVTWAKSAIMSPKTEARKVVWLVIAMNRNLDTQVILSATDAAIKTAVTSAVETLLI